MKCTRCGYDDKGTGDSAHICSSEPDWSDSKTLPTEMWKNRFHPMNDRLEIADGAIQFRDEVIANLRNKIAELEHQLASFAQGVKISIPTEVMEQEFQNHYRRGYTAGVAASHHKEDKA